MTQDRPPPRRWLPLLVLLTAIYWLSCPPGYYPGDDRYYLNLCRSLVERGAVDLDLTGSTRPPDPECTVRGPDGRRYAIYGLGHPLVLAPFHLLGRLPATLLPDDAGALWTRLCLGLCPALAMALAVTLGALTGSRLGYSWGSCKVWALGLGLGTLVWPGSKPLLSEPTQTLLLSLLIHLIVRFVESPGGGLAGGIGVVTGLLAAVKISFLPVVPVVVALILWRERGAAGRSLVALAVPLGAFLLMLGWYNWVRCGSFASLGYEGGRSTRLGFSTPLLTGLHGLLLGTGKGVFWYSPWLLLALPGIGSFWRRHRAVSLAIWAISLAHLGIHATWWAWAGDWSWGPRFLIPLHPLVGLMALPFLERALARREGRWGVAALLALAGPVQLLGVLIAPFPYLELTTAMPAGLVMAGKPPLGEPSRADELFHVHHVPAFSPLAGHAWLIRRGLAGPRPGDHPWAHLGIQGSSPRMDMSAPWDLWWLSLRPGDQTVLGWLALALMVTLAVGSASRLGRDES